MPTGMLLRGNKNQREHLIRHYENHLNHLISRPMNGSARGSLMFEMEGKWTTKDLMLSQGFVCEKKTGDFCIFDMVPYSNLCFDFRLDTRQDLHTWQGARDQCEVYGLQMMQISNTNKDEWINTYLVGTDLFPVDGDTNGIWLGGQGNC
jgi:hypothetical protein